MGDLTTLERLRAAFDPDRVHSEALWANGVVDLVENDLPSAKGIGPWLMRTKFYAAPYDRMRAQAMRRFSRDPGLTRELDRARVASALRLREGQAVLDLCCGPGSFTCWFGSVVGASGLVVGLDASKAMLDKAVADYPGDNVAYVRGDALRLPFRTGSVDVVAFLAAIYLVADPPGVLKEIARVLAPGGRVLILSSVLNQNRAIALGERLFSAVGGVNVFAKDQIPGWLRELGFDEVEQEIAGMVQRVSATKA